MSDWCSGVWAGSRWSWPHSTARTWSRSSSNVGRHRTASKVRPPAAGVRQAGETRPCISAAEGATFIVRACGRTGSPGAGLAQGLVQRNADGGGEVEAADLAGRHGDEEGAAGVALEHRVRQAVRLAAEQEAVARLVAGGGV